MEGSGLGMLGPELLPTMSQRGRLRSLLEMFDGNHLSPLCVARMREERHHAIVSEHATIARPDRQEPALRLSHTSSLPGTTVQSLRCRPLAFTTGIGAA